MKKFSLVFVVAILVICASLSLTACYGGGNIAGSWQATIESETIVYTFGDELFIKKTNGIMTEEGTYSISRDKLFLMGNQNRVFDFSVKKDRLTISYANEGMVTSFVFLRVSTEQ